MIRFHLKKMIEEAEFQRGKRIRIEDVAKETGIHRTTLSKLANIRGYNVTTDIIDKLCCFFGCSIEKIAEYVPDETVSTA